jgi:hypothetical protein
MSIDPAEVARRVLAADRQLTKIRDRILAGHAGDQVAHYNGVVDTLHACFSIDPNFSNAIKHIEHLKESTPDFATQMESDRTTLSETARRFVAVYLPTEDHPEFES